ncbi:multimerin-2-like [Mya arenaria]|uniref:multimerin-2-like n=1 Tax=Mya arenaria TaxID=6604 RepID=UPI0022E7F57B|nr:multimerin-2-like [Mya arenaria]
MLNTRIVFLLNLSILLWCVSARISRPVSDELATLKEAVGDILRHQHERDDRIDILEEEIEKLNEILETQSEQLDHQKRVIREQESEIRQQKERVGNLENIIYDLLTEKKYTEKELASKDDGADASQSSAHSNDEKHARRDVQKIRQIEVGTAVAFLATMFNQNEHTGTNQPLVFERVVTNIGGAYNPHFGTFLAPVNGVYVFTVTLLSSPNQVAHYYLYQNNTPVVHLTLYHPSSETYTSMSQTAVLSLNKGDDVSVRNLDAGTRTLGDNYSSFSGFILWMTEAQTPDIVG